ncbi:hypothetical protein MBLNU13_g08619t1 [Cladosporium sp. NU13]
MNGKAVTLPHPHQDFLPMMQTSRSYGDDAGPVRSHADASAGARADAAPISDSLAMNDTLQPIDSQEMSPQPLASPAPHFWSPSPADHERLLGLFYLHIFGAHPFLVPKAFYASQNYPHYLDLVVCFAGQQYAAPTSDTTLLQSAVTLAMSEADEQTPYRVQALVLYAIVLHASQRAKEAGDCVSRAATTALQLGMNEASFARTNSSNSSVAEESLRRTWWELYIVDDSVKKILRLFGPMSEESFQ